MDEIHEVEGVHRGHEEILVVGEVLEVGNPVETIGDLVEEILGDQGLGVIALEDVVLEGPGEVILEIREVLEDSLAEVARAGRGGLVDQEVMIREVLGLAETIEVEIKEEKETSDLTVEVLEEVTQEVRDHEEIQNLVLGAVEEIPEGLENRFDLFPQKTFITYFSFCLAWDFGRLC